MPKFAANLHYLFTEVPFMDRFAAAANAGFRGIEFQVPYVHNKDELRERIEQNGLELVLFDTPMRKWDEGERGITCLPGREAEFRKDLDDVVEYSKALNCKLVHVVAGVVKPGMDFDECRQTYIKNLRHACEFFAPHGIHAVIEPINKKLGVSTGSAEYTTQGMQGYFLNHTAEARTILDEVARPNLWLHLDCYHMQMLEGHLAETLRENIGRLKHLQIAGVPGRYEPDIGEINYPYIFDLLDEIGYDGWVACEYRPKGKTLEGFGWAAKYGIGRKGG